MSFEWFFHWEWTASIHLDAVDTPPLSLSLQCT
jgi:hypothetical protein